MADYICFGFDTYIMFSAEDLDDTIIVVGGMFLILFVNFLLLHIPNEIMQLFCVFSTLFKCKCHSNEVDNPHFPVDFPHRSVKFSDTFHRFFVGFPCRKYTFFW